MLTTGMLQVNRITGVDPGFLERGFKIIKVCVCVCWGGGGGGGEGGEAWPC